MQAYHYTATVTLVALLVYVFLGIQVSRAHVKAGIPPPKMIGDPQLEQTIRGHLNMLEWMPVFLPSLWLFAIYWNDKVAALAGVAWIVGRAIYFYGYVAKPEGRFVGFFIQLAAVAFLLFGALGRVVYLAATGG